MKKFSELKVGDEFYAESNISLADLENYGLLVVDFEGTKENGDLVVVSKRNLYQIKKGSLANR